jgi:hypothetical protein
MNSAGTFVALVARGITPLYASVLALSVVLLIGVLFLMVRELRRPKKSKKISRRILERLGSPPAGSNSADILEFDYSEPNHEDFRTKPLD